MIQLSLKTPHLAPPGGRIHHRKRGIQGAAWVGILGRATRAGGVWIGVKMFKEKVRGEGRKWE